MKSSTVAAILAFGLPPLASAWRLQLFRNTGYQVTIEDKTDFFSTSDPVCIDLATDLRGQTSSMKWENEGVFGACTVHLYYHTGCSIPIVVKTQNTNIVNMKAVGEDDKVSSWKVICNEDIG